jgi:acetyl-CoA acetyltransferase
VIPPAAAIAGIGATEFSKDSRRSELRLAAEATLAALADAGLDPADVDGLVTFTMDSTAEIALARELGLGDLRFFSHVGYGGGAACGCVLQAVLAITAGIADVVVCYRALNERSGHRFGQVSLAAVRAATSSGVDNGWHYPMGLSTPAATVAMIARRYMHDYGATSEDFGRVTVADRRHAATNPKAWFYQRPVTLAEHQASRWIAEPLRLLDCCQESDGAVAVVVTSAERARGLRQRPTVIRAAAQGSSPGQFTMTSYYRDELGLPEMGVVARQLWRQAGIGPVDVRTAVLYDHFTPYVLLQLEELGFCPRGQARHFIAGGAIELGGALPLNPHGGQLGEAYIHGMNGIAEAVRQIRGTSVKPGTRGRPGAGHRRHRRPHQRPHPRPRLAAPRSGRVKSSGYRVVSGLCAGDGLPGGLAVSGAAVAGGAGHAGWLGAGGWQVEVVKVGLGHGAVEADRFVGHRQG